MSYSWIKLYIEILDDPKVGLMPDWLKWRMIQLFLVAREYNRDGLLGPVPQLAWRLRIAEDDLVGSLRTLSEIGIVAATPDGWLVRNFKKRQDAATGTERSQECRSRKSNATKRCTNGNEAGDKDSVSLSASDSGSDSGEGGSGGEPRQTAPELEEDDFIRQCAALVGIYPTANDLPVIAAWEKQGVIPDDIRDALQWRKDNEKAPVKIISNLAGGVETARLKRIQGQNAKPGKNGNGHKPDIAEQWAERARSHGNSANL